MCMKFWNLTQCAIFFTLLLCFFSQQQQGFAHALNLTTHFDTGTSKSDKEIRDYFLQRGIKIAAQYNGKECLRLRNDPRIINNLERMSIKIVGSLDALYNPVNLSPVLQKNLAKPIRAVYVRNQKAASTFFIGNAESFAGKVDSSQGFRYPYRFRHSKSYPKTMIFTPHLESDLYFSFVREPISCFIAAWLEVQVHTMPKSKGSSSHKIDGSKLFKEFLNNVIHNKEMSSIAFHAWPQVYTHTS